MQGHGLPAPGLRGSWSLQGGQGERVLDQMSFFKRSGKELERFDGLSLIYW